MKENWDFKNVQPVNSKRSINRGVIWDNTKQCHCITFINKHWFGKYVTKKTKKNLPETNFETLKQLRIFIWTEYDVFFSYCITFIGEGSLIYLQEVVDVISYSVWTVNYIYKREYKGQELQTWNTTPPRWGLTGLHNIIISSDREKWISYFQMNAQRN